MQALVIGTVSAPEREAMRFAAGRAGASLAFFASFEDAAERIGGHSAPNVACFLTTSEYCAAVASSARDHAHLFAVPIIALVTHASEAGYRDAYVQGADDVLPCGDLGGITRRLANLRDRPIAARPPANQGLAVVGFPDIARRRVLGRTLRQAGFEVAYAQDTEELMRAFHNEGKPCLLVTHPGLPPEGAATAIEAVRQLIDEPQFPALVLSAFRHEDAGEDDRSDSEQAGRVLFFAEEALRGSAKDQRASHRILHHNLCSFREAGAFSPIYGLTHNISRRGLYVRTLDPPRTGVTVWVEMRAPSLSEPMVHLRGKVVWRREARQMGGATPPGFGVRIEWTQCPPLDLRAYELGYEQVLDRTLSPSFIPAVNQ